MALSTSVLDADIAALIADMPETLTFSGTSYTVTRSRLRRTDVLAMEGLRDRYSCTFWIQASDFDTQPSMGDLVAVGGKNYRVLAKDTDDLDQLVGLHVGEEHHAG